MVRPLDIYSISRLSLSFAFAFVRFVRTVVEAWVFPLDPFHERLNVFVFKQSLDGMVVIVEFPLRQGSMDLAMADLMHPDLQPTLESFRDEMMLIDIDRTERAVAEGTGFHCRVHGCIVHSTRTVSRPQGRFECLRR